MNKSKKLTAAVAASAVATAIVAPVASAAVQFDDIKGSYAQAQIAELVEKGILSGFPGGKFQPTGKITRQDFAIVMAKALKLDMSNPPATATFSDVKTTDYSFAAVEAAVKANLMKGNGKTFGYGENLSRQDMAVIVVNALGVDATGLGAKLAFSDKDKIASYAKDAVAFAKDAGIISGNSDGTFNPTGNAERQAVAVVASNFLKAAEVYKTAQLKTVSLKDNATIEISFTKAVESLTAADIKVASKGDNKAVAVSNIVLSADKKSATFKAELAGSTTYTVTYGTKTAEVTTAAETALVAQSVTSTNLKQIVVNFNNELDADTVVKGNFKLDGSALAAGDTVVLNKDGKSVTINLGTEFATNQVEFAVTVTGVKDVSGSVVEDTTLEGVSFDVSIPEALKVEQVGPTSLKVTFSEPVKANTAVFKVDGGKYFVNTASVIANADNTTLTFDLYSVLPVGAHKVSISDVEDFAKYKAVTKELSFDAIKDEVAPTVSKVVSASPERVVIEFSEDIKFNGTKDVSKYYHTNATNAPTAVNIINGNQLELLFDATHVLPNGTAYLYIAKDQLKDGWDNKVAAINTTLEVTVDKIKPVVEKVEAKTDKSIVVTYSEAVKAAAGDKANYTVLNSAGEKVTTFTSAVTDSKTVTLTFSPALAGSEYTIVAEKIEDLAGNVIEKMEKKVSVTDTTPPTVTGNAKLYSNAKIVKIEFDEVMNSSDLLNLANYQIGSEYLNTLKVTASVTDNGKAVLLDFSKATGVTLSTGMSVGKLRDAAGNYTTAFSTPVTFVDQDANGILIDSVEAIDTKTVKVTLADALTTFDAEDFVLTYGAGNTAVKISEIASFENKDGKAVITYVLADDNLFETNGMIAGTDALNVTTKATTKSANAFGVKVKANHAAETADDKIVAVVEKTTVGTEQVDDVTIAAGKITINYSEDLDPTSLSKLSYSVAGYTVTAVALDATNADWVVLTVTANSADSSATPTVTQVADIADANDIVVKGGTTYKSH